MDKATTKNISSKQILRLKKGSIPTILLNITEKRKGTFEDNDDDNKRKKTLIRTGVPTYTELVQYVQEKQHAYLEQTTSGDVCEDKHNLSLDVTMKETTNEEIIREENISVQTLLKLLKKSEEEKNKLLMERTKIVEENITFNDKNKKLNSQLELLQKNMQEESNLAQKEINIVKETQKRATDALHKFFTPGQIKILMSANSTRIKWSSDDIISAIALRSLSPKAYRFLRNVKKMPLPCMSTLNNWCAIFTIQPGILKNVLKIMEDKGRDLNMIEKLTVLSFDELYISNRIDLERRKQKIYGPHKTCQFIMARDLFSKWKQPIYYDFDQAMSANILLLVLEMYQINYIVVAITCDMSPTNVKLWKELNIGTNIPSSVKTKNIDIDKKCFIVHPADNSLKVFFYADIPHLLKLARNNFFDSGFRVKGHIINKDVLEELLTLNEGDLKMAHKISRLHLDAKGSQRQNVRMAAQIFSNRNAMAIQWCGENGLLKSSHWKETADIL